MSKRSQRRKRRERQQKAQTQLTGSELVERGQLAFQQGNYEAAINDWTQAQHKKDVPARLKAAIAEAYFRRGLAEFPPVVADLAQAVKLMPDEVRYRYHMALAHHHLGQLTDAEPLYRQLLKESYERARVPLAQLLIEQGKPLSKDEVWTQLPKAAKTQLTAAEAIVRKKAKSTLQQLLDTELEPLWRGLVALALDEWELARPELQLAIEQANAGARAVAYYYTGLLDPEHALEHWRAAQAAGLNTPTLQRNLARRLVQHAEQQLSQPAQALASLDEAITVWPALKSNSQALQSHLHWASGYQAAQRQDWEAALRHWQAISGQNDSRAMTLNLALAYQKMEHFAQAAEEWRYLLRRRPRKTDHPDYLSDAQVARLWQTIAENYAAMGDYEESVKTFKTAVKWSPDNLDLRLKLAEALQDDGRWQAAANELNRILDKNPDFIPAMLLLADSYAGDFMKKSTARQLLRRVRELEPHNPIARQQLIQFYIGESRWQLWGGPEREIEVLKEGLAEIPDSTELMILLAATYGELGDMDACRQYIDQALVTDPNNLAMLMSSYGLATTLQFDELVNRAFEQLTTMSPLPPVGALLDLVDRCLYQDQPDGAKRLMTFIQDTYSDDPKAMFELALMYIHLDDLKIATHLLRDLVEGHPNVPHYRMHLGVAYYKADQTRLAERQWKETEKLAKQSNNYRVLFELDNVKNRLIHGQPPQGPFGPVSPAMIRKLLDDAPPGLLDSLDELGLFDDDDDDEEFLF